MPQGISQDQQRAAADRIELFARSIFAIKGLAAPGMEVLAPIIASALSRLSPHEIRHPDDISPSAIGDIHSIIAAAKTDRPTNIYSADAPPGGKGGFGIDKVGAKGIDPQDRSRAVPSSVRYRDLPAGEGTGGSFIGERGMAGVPQEFIRAFAGAGVGRDSIKAFASVGLDRGTFDQFRHEGYSAKQIVDNAKDMKVLGGHGKADLIIGQHAPTDLRKAAVDVDKEKDPEKKKKKQQHEADVAHKYDALPDTDPRKKGAKDFINWLEKHGHHIEHGQEKGARAKQGDNSLRAEHPAAGPNIARVQDKNAAGFKKLEVASLNKNDQDDWGSSAAPDTKKPEPTKAGDSKPDAKKPTPVRAADAKPPGGPKPS